MLLAALAGLLVTGAVLTIIDTLARPTPDVANDAPPPATRATRRVAARVAGAAVAFLVVLVASRLVLPALVVAGAASWFGTQLTSGGRGHGAGVERLEALATWTEQLRDVLIAGDTVRGTIAATQDTAPPVLRPQVRALAARLGRQSDQVSLRQFADDIDDPAADLVAVGLLIAVTKGGKTEGVLTALAAQTRHQADRRKLIEAERTTMRRSVRIVSIVMAAQLAAILVFARSDYLARYHTPSGQIVLSVFLGVFVGLLVWVQRLGRYPRPSRFLTLDGLR